MGSNETAPSDGTGSGSNGSDSASPPPTLVTAASDSDSGTTSSGGSTDDGDDTDPVVWDVAARDTPELCAPPVTRACDDADNAWYHAMGLGCDGGVSATFAKSTAAGALHILEGELGTAGSFAPVEGTKMAILSTGRARDLPMTLEELMVNDPLCDAKTCPSSDLSTTERINLPEPLNVRRVADDGTDCADDPTLVGKGDCSNSLWDHWILGSGANDYSELRVTMTVPETADAFQYSFAFFSSEYPLFIDHDAAEFNDMYVAWLESESWTGNISFDEEGNPITVHSVLLDYRTESVLCPDCVAPELAGFAMEEHAGTKWLTTRAPVEPGEEIELIFAVFDLSDPLFDSMVILDGFEWTCADGPPITWAG